MWCGPLSAPAGPAAWQDWPADSGLGPATAGPSPTRPWRPATPSEDSCYLAHDGETDDDILDVQGDTDRITASTCRGNQWTKDRNSATPGEYDEGENITANALHPGLVRTNIARNNGLLGRVVNFFIGVRGVALDKGAETPVYLAASHEVEGVTGRYFVDCRPAPSSGIRYDAELAAQLWDLSRSLTTVAVHRPIESFGKSRRMTNSVFRARRYDPYHAVVRGNELGWERSAISTGVREAVNGAAFRYHGCGISMNGIADPRGRRRKYLGNIELSRGG